MRTWHILLILALVFVAWVIVVNGVGEIGWLNQSNLGSKAEGINSLFSAFAFAVLIYTAILQQNELSLQREELKATREEFHKQSEEFKKQNDLALLSNYRSTLFNLIQLNKKVVESITTSQHLVYYLGGGLRQFAPSRVYTGQNCFIVFEEMLAESFRIHPKMASFQSDAPIIQYLESSNVVSLAKPHLVDCVTAISNFMYYPLFSYFAHVKSVLKFIASSKDYNTDWENDFQIFENSMTRQERVVLSMLIVTYMANDREIKILNGLSLIKNVPDLHIYKHEQQVYLKFNRKITDAFQEIMNRDILPVVLSEVK